MNAFRKRHRFIDERIEISLPIGHGNFPRYQAYLTEPGAATLGSREVWTMWTTDDRMTPRGRGCVGAAASTCQPQPANAHRRRCGAGLSIADLSQSRRCDDK